MSKLIREYIINSIKKKENLADKVHGEGTTNELVELINNYLDLECKRIYIIFDGNDLDNRIRIERELSDARHRLNNKFLDIQCLDMC